jgi:glycosyltransferase involved in cell wall biosynthesis
MTHAGEMGQSLRSLGVPVHEIGIRGRTYAPAGILRLAAVLRTVRTIGARLVHTFLFDADVFGMVAGRIGGARAITTRRAIKTGKRGQLAAYRLTNPLVAGIVANSHEVRRFTLRAEKAPPEKVLVIPNGIDTARFSDGDGNRVRSSLGIPGTAQVVGTVGTVKPVKGQDVLFDAVAPLFSRLSDLVVLVAGNCSSPWASELRSRVARAGLGERFRFLGGREDVPDFLAALDVFVLPSRSEGMSNALLEAMAASRAVVATRVGGNAEALDEGAAGRVVPAGEPGAMGEALAELLQDEPRRVVLGGRAGERARMEYDLSIMLDRTERLYDRVLEGSRIQP